MGLFGAWTPHHKTRDLDVYVEEADQSDGPRNPDRVRLSYLGTGPRPSSVCRVKSALFDHREISETALVTLLRSEGMRYSAVVGALDWLVANEARAEAGASAITRILRGNHTCLQIRPELFTTTIEYRTTRGAWVVWRPTDTTPLITEKPT